MSEVAQTIITEAPKPSWWDSLAEEDISHNFDSLIIDTDLFKGTDLVWQRPGVEKEKIIFGQTRPDIQVQVTRGGEVRRIRPTLSTVNALQTAIEVRLRRAGEIEAKDEHAKHFSDGLRTAYEGKGFGKFSLKERLEELREEMKMYK